jgi:hypothetical protein
MSLRKGTECSLRKNASEHAMGAGRAPPPGWVGAERHPTLPEEEKEERAETSGGRDGDGALVESVKRRG